MRLTEEGLNRFVFNKLGLTQRNEDLKEKAMIARVIHDILKPIPPEDREDAIQSIADFIENYLSDALPEAQFKRLLLSELLKTHLGEVDFSPQD
jgi:HD superfamily phosphohydrolase YqeK